MVRRSATEWWHCVNIIIENYWFKTRSLHSEAPLFHLVSYYSSNMATKQPRHIAEGEGDCPPLVPGSLRFYNMKYCPYARRTLLVLLHKNVTFDIVNINLKKKPSWFLAKSSVGLVPLLERSDGQTFGESLIAMQYLEEVYPEPAILPSDPWKKAEEKVLVEESSKVVSCIFKVYSAKSAEDRQQAIERFTKELDVLDEKLGKRGTAFFSGDKPGYADFAIWPWVERLPLFKDLFNASPVTERHGNLLRWMTVMPDVPAVKALLIPPSEHLHFVKTHLNGSPDYDSSL